MFSLFVRLGDKPGGIEKASDNLRKLRKEFDKENIGLMRMNSKAMNPEGEGRIVWVFHPDDVKAVFR